MCSARLCSCIVCTLGADAFIIGNTDLLLHYKHICALMCLNTLCPGKQWEVSNLKNVSSILSPLYFPKVEQIINKVAFSSGFFVCVFSSCAILSY